jgi:hypothetical protein
VTLPPVQNDSGPPAVIVGVEGLEFMVTLTVPDRLEQPPTVAITVYVPDAAVVTFEIDGFCEVDEKPLGPVQLYVAPVISDAVRLSVAPAHNGLLLPAVGAVKFGFTVTATEPGLLVQPLTVAVTL